MIDYIDKTFAIVVIDLMSDEEDESTDVEVDSVEKVPELFPYPQVELPLQIIE